MQKSNWIYACKTADMPHNGGVCVQYGTEQIALYYFTHRKEWYATQNLCPHKKQMALSRGILGSQQGEPKVACPFHKKTFSLKNGECLNDENCSAIKTYPVKVHEGNVFIDIASLLTPNPSTYPAYEQQ
ncbi:nitrite reductase small subunit [Niabella ginsenosidivorans]|uniref:Nitrite reductase small subunit n=1 Tax=Niabella ginsenosidivorans TaxID=1176587 RepID=A0A1A9HXG8_9BACT|nr:nitrite reductase small subunit NirD [Niabella ginsenosidivorans]ANH79775.1 nitrite reductase small subunit [Niabella ginsenosidivorans]